MTDQLTYERLIALMRRKWVTNLVGAEQAGCWSVSQRAGQFRRDPGAFLKPGEMVQDKWVRLPSGKRVKAFRIVTTKQEETEA